MKVKSSKNRRKLIQAIPFMLPSFIGMLIFSFIPMIMAMLISLTNWSGLEQFSLAVLGRNFAGFSNYKNILMSNEFWAVLWHTVYYIILYIPLAFISAMLIALILNTGKKFTPLFRVLYYIPVLTSWVAASLIWKWVLSSQYGIFNQLLALIGITGPAWLNSRVWAMPGIVLASVWKDMGFYGLFILGGLSGIDQTYYEAARVDGAGKAVTFFRITIPMLSPSLFFCLVMSLINAFQLFPQVQIMTQGGPNGATQVLVERIYTYAFSYFNMGYASAYSWLLCLIILILTVIQMKLQKAWVHYEA